MMVEKAGCLECITLHIGRLQRKCSVFPVYAMKTWRSGHIGPLILNISSGWRPLYPCGKSSCNPINRRLCEPQSKSGHFGE